MIKNRVDTTLSVNDLSDVQIFKTHTPGRIMISFDQAIIFITYEDFQRLIEKVQEFERNG